MKERAIERTGPRGAAGLSWMILVVTIGAPAGTPAKDLRYLDPDDLFRFEKAAGEEASIEIDFKHPGKPVSRLLYGKFTEHLGRNIYGGMWAQILRNPGFEPASFFPGRGRRRVMTEEHPGVATYWQPFGGEKTAPDHGLDPDAFNSNTAQRITLSGREGAADPGARGGIAQGIYLPIHRTGSFTLAFHAKARGFRGELAVSIRRGPAREGTIAPRPGEAPTLGEAVFSGLDGEWKEYRSRIDLDRSGIARGAPFLFAVELRGTGTVLLDQAFLFPADHVRGFDPDVVRLIRESRLPILRYPGGNFSSGYHWEDGVGPVHSRPMRRNPAWDVPEYNHVGTDEFMAFCNAVECEPMICVNAGNGTAEEAARWVEYCNGPPSSRGGARRAANGHPEPYRVRFWEVGNEIYGSWQIGHTTAPEYAERYALFHGAMTAVDPSIRVIACGNDEAWNEPLVRRCAGILRSVSIHTLIGSGIPSTADPENVWQVILGYPTWYQGHLRRIAARLADAVPEPRVAITELQIFTNKRELPNNTGLAEALFLGRIIHTAIRQGELVEMITHSALVNHGGGLRKEREFVYPNPVHLASKLYATQPGTVPVATRVTTPTYSARERGMPDVRDAPYLDAIALRDSDGERLVLLAVNTHPGRPVQAAIRILGFDPAEEVTVKTIEGGLLDRNSFDEPERVRLGQETRRLVGSPIRHAFPARSVTAMFFARRRA